MFCLIKEDEESNSKTKVTVILNTAQIIRMTMSIIIDRFDAKILVGDKDIK